MGLNHLSLLLFAMPPFSLGTRGSRVAPTTRTTLSTCRPTGKGHRFDSVLRSIYSIHLESIRGRAIAGQLFLADGILALMIRPSQDRALAQLYRLSPGWNSVPQSTGILARWVTGPLG